MESLDLEGRGLQWLAFTAANSAFVFKIGLAADGGRCRIRLNSDGMYELELLMRSGWVSVQTSVSIQELEGLATQILPGLKI